MIGYDTDDYWDDAPSIAKGNYNLWRLMIDSNYQNKGYGKEAASQLYRSFGFAETGERDGEELIAILKL